jgi:hypothetical protein
MISDDEVAAMLILNRDTFYVIDGKESRALVSQCKTLFISSTRDEHFKYYRNQRKAKLWYFPVWTLEELDQCRKKCYPVQPVEVLKERFRIYGGVARYAFFDCTDSTQYARQDPSEMDDALVDADAIKGLAAAGNPTAMFPTSHTLLHMIIGEKDAHDYQFLHMDFASDYVEEQLWVRSFQTMIQNFQQIFLSAPEQISRGLFENYCHFLFSKGEFELKCRCLEDDAVSTLVLDRIDSQRVLVTKDSLPSGIGPCYYDTRDDATFPAVDAVTYQGMFQYTVGQNHPIRGITVLKQLCGLYSEPKLYFVVPPSRFERFRKQRFDNLSNTQVDPIENLKQYVLEIPIDKDPRAPLP